MQIYCEQLKTASSTDKDMRNINADLVLGALTKHQRDLFTGTLGIPDVTKHVGSVIHAFETMAMQRNHGQNMNNTKQMNEPNMTFRQYQEERQLQHHQQQHLHHQQQQQQQLSASSSPIQQILNINNLRNNHNKINLSTITRPPLSQSQTLFPHHEYTIQSATPTQQQKRHQQQQLIMSEQNEQSQSKHGQYEQSEVNFQTFPKILTKPKPNKNNNKIFLIPTDNDSLNLNDNNVDVDDDDENDEEIPITQLKRNDKHMRNSSDDYRRSSFVKLSSSSSSNNNNNNKNSKLSYQSDVDKPTKTKTRGDYGMQTSMQHHHTAAGTQPHLKLYTKAESGNDDDFVRGSTVSQSFIKNVKNPGTRKKSTYEQNLNLAANNSNSSNFKRDKYSSSTGNISDNRNATNISSKAHNKNPIGVDELELRYTQHSRNSNKRKSFQPRTLDRAEL